MTRRLTIGILATALAVATPALSSASSAAGTPMKATPALAPVVQPQSGVALGEAGLTLDVVHNNARNQDDRGSYASTGQLGRGTYDFEMTFDGAQCVHESDTMTASGSAQLVRSDGAVASGTVKASEVCRAGATPVTFDVTLTHGTRDLVSAHLQFTGAIAFHVTPSGDAGPEAFAFAGTSSALKRIGYWMVQSNGSVYAFGGVNRLGDAPTFSAVHIEPTPSRNGYWIVDTLGQVFAFGDAHSYGNAVRSALLGGEVITSLSSTPTGHGYWLFTDRGRALPFGDAKFFGDMHTVALNGPVIGSVATPTGRGYYMVASDGGVFTFGDAVFRGSMGAAHLNQPVNGLVPTAGNDGYWLVAADGGVFSFHAPFLGSMGAVPLSQPVIGMVRYGSGYMIVAQDGGIFDFSTQPFFGSLGASPPATPIVGAASAG